jgi:YD repeat-containing protein
MTNSVPSPIGRYWRGTGSDPTYWSFVVPLDYEKGVTYDNVFGNCATLYPGLLAWDASTFYHYNATNSSSSTNWATRIPFNNPIVAFGERVGGTPLYLNQEYNFAIYAGDPVTVGAPITILAYYRTNYGYAGEIDINPPNFSDTNSWNNFTSNGFQVIASGFGLTNTLSASPNLSWGSTSRGAYALSHVAGSATTNYYYAVLAYGIPNSQSFGMVQATNGYIAPSYLYSLEFEQRPPWRSVMIDQPHFDGNPLPPFYAGMTLDELLTNTPPVTNAVSLAPTACTNIDQSPELRRSPILDQFVADMGNDPMALANYVLNEIDLTDPMDYNDNGNVSEQSINLGGVSRGALGTFQEKQGSPVEQCALLVYLLRQAGVPATYMYPPHNGLQILDARLSRMLKFQVHGGFSEPGQLYTTNTMIPVNYPWVAAYIGTNWVHIFPWLKDYEIVEGLNLYEYMPTNYSDAYGWVKDYVYGNSNLLSLAVNGNNTPRVIFPRYLAQTLQQNHPGISVDDIGVKILNRRHNYARWQDFPTPTWLTNTALAVESLTANSITNVDPLLTNIFDTVSVELYSQTDPRKDIQSGAMRLTDLHNRQFYITQTNNATNQVLLSLVLAPFRTNVTTQYAFTNDAPLLSKEVLSTTLDQFDDVLWIRITYNRHRALSLSYPIDSSQPYLAFKDSPSRQIVVERPMRKGDLAAICLDYGRVTQDMLNVHATDLWQMENALRANPAAAVSPDVYQGATMYLAGMSYYKKVSDFEAVNQNLHKVNVLSSWAAGLSKLGPRRDSSGNLVNGGVDPVFPNVDMAFQEVAEVANETLRPDSGQDLELAMQNYNLILLIDGSAEEHQVLNDFYNQSNAVSTVRLLQLAQSLGYGIVTMNVNNYAGQGTTVYRGNQLQNYDSYVWNQVATAMQSTANGDYGFATAYMTAGPVTNASYSGVGALILGWAQSQAIISPFSLNGGFGENLQPNSVSAGNAVNFNLTMGDNATLTFQTPTAATTLLPDQIPNFNTSQVYNQILSGDYTATPYNSTWSANVQSQLNLSSQSTQNQTIAQDVQATQQKGFWGWLTDAGSQVWSKVADPVDNITGEFYIAETDLRLAGPIPLSLGRNYSSLNLADNQFGQGWKFSIAPYLSIAQGATNIYAADMDGSVLDYVQTPTNSNVWLPTTVANPQLVNNTTAGVGGLVNRLRDRLVQTVSGSTTNFTLFGTDGSIRAFQFMTFNSGVLNQTRPYLLAWTNNCGNFYTFTYGTDPSQPDFGQVRRIQCSNGNYLGFYYDVYGHIIEAYCGDGRRLTYDYDEFGDLITVTLPDATTRSYQYLHGTQSVTNGSTVTQQPYSTHLIIEEDKPDGRVLQNAYDSQRRVTNQLSTAGDDLTPVRTATFAFSNNFNLTNSPTNATTGYTLVVDGNNHTNRYDYTNSLITQITDPLGQTIQQIWYADNSTAPGYPRSVSQRKDKRGIWSQFKYDAYGNVTNTVITGDITGDGISTQTATNTAIYNTNNLPLQHTDPVGNSTVYVYDTNFPFMPQQVIRYSGATPICTNFQAYGSVTNTVTLGSITQTNLAFGVMTRAIRAFNSPDAATNDFTYNGQGFITQSVRYTGTSDPAVTNTLFYNERGELVIEADALGAAIEFSYDAMSRVTGQENFDEMGNLLSWNYNYYNDNGELTWVDGPRYNPEDYIWKDYDGAGRLTTEIHWRCEGKQDGTGVEAPAGYNMYAQTFYQYDILGDMLRSIDPRGAITTNTWDALCRLVQRRSLDVDGVTLLASEGFAYEPGGLVRYHTNALGGLTETEYTAAGQPEYRHNADGSTNGWRYYLDGRIYRQFQCNGAYWQTTYDDLDRITTNIFYSAAGVALATNSSQLDRRGNVIAHIDAGQNVFTTTYDGLDRTKITAGPTVVTVSGGGLGFPGGGSGYTTNVLQQSMTYFYDGSGRVLTTTNTLGEKTVTTKDAVGRIVSVQIYAPGSGTPLRVTTTTYTADHHSFTVTQGTGTNEISATTYTDNDGRTLLTARSPGTGQLDYDLHQYDLAGNEIEHDKASTGSLLWSFTSWAFDGLNRALSETTRDFATTSFAYDALGDLTSRTMPAGLTWSATYSTAGQILSEHDQSGTQGARTNTYTYYASSWPGLLQTITDGRGVTRTNLYDDFLRLTNTTATGSQAEQQMTVSWQYELRGFVTAVTQSYASTNTGPSTTIQRAYDAYGQLSTDSGITQQWDAAGRRTQVGGIMSFQYRADDLITAVNDATFGYGDNGLLAGRTNSFRSVTVNQRDPLGRPMQMTTKVLGVTKLTETWNWLGDGSPSNYVAARSDFTDTRNFAYGSLTRKLTQESFNLGSSLSLTNAYTFDNGVAAGVGVLTKANELSVVSNSWSGGVDALSRITNGTNSVIQRSASGTVNGAATLRGYLNGQPIDLRYDSRSASAWAATFGLQAGTNTLTVYADHPSGFFTTNKTSTFTVNSGTQDRVTSQYDGAGNVTNLTWKNGSGQISKSQTLTWDAFIRLVKVNERDTNNNGFNLSVSFDAIGRQLQTVETAVSNNIALSVGPQPLTIGYTYDPQVEFEIIGFSLSQGVNARQDSLTYGPDISGSYGGMQGVGGLEEITSGDANVLTTAGVISDGFGNVLAGITNGLVTWNAARLSLYGPADGYTPPRLSLGSPAYASLAWRTRPLNTAGLVELGLRPYDYTRRAFLSADPLGHSSDGALNTAFGGNPSVYFDADGRVSKGIYNEGALDASALSSSVFWGGVGDTSYGVGARAVNGVVQSGEIGYDMVAQTSWALGGAGGDYQGVSQLYQNIYNNPNDGPTASSILTGTLEAEANFGTLGLYGMGKGFGEAAATGDYTAAQDASLGSLLVSTGVRGMQAAGVDPLSFGYTPTAVDQSLIAMFKGETQGSDAAPSFQAESSTQPPGGSVQPSGTPRLSQDINVDPTPPDPLAWEARTVGLNANQNQMVIKDATDAYNQGATDIRINQQQVDANGVRVGVNRPDLQYTDANGNRIYIEYDTPTSPRAIPHQVRIQANDPTATVILKTVQ